MKLLHIEVFTYFNTYINQAFLLKSFMISTFSPSYEVMILLTAVVQQNHYTFLILNKYNKH